MATRRRGQPERDAGDRHDGDAAHKDAAFRNHLVAFLVTGFFLLTLNLLTSPDSLWFYWPLFFWGWAVVIHALTTYGANAPAGVLAAMRSIVPGGNNASRPESEPARATPTPPPAASIDDVEERVKRLWRVARQVPEGAVRDQAFRICAAADRVAEVMATDRTAPETIAWFNERLLKPTETMLSQYVRLRGREVAGAGPTLRRVEEESLPEIESRFDALYDQLHRGAVVDLAVASEMLEFELPDFPPGRSIGSSNRR